MPEMNERYLTDLMLAQNIQRLEQYKLACSDARSQLARQMADAENRLGLLQWEVSRRARHKAQHAEG